MMNGSPKLYVNGIPFSATEAEITELFAEYGPVHWVRLGKLPDGRAAGYAFIELSSGQGAQRAIEGLNGSKWKGRWLRVEEARRKPANQSGI